MLKRYLAKGGKVLFMLDPPDKPESGRAPEPHRRCSRTGRSRSATTSSSTSAAWDSCSAPGPKTPVAASYQPHPITERFKLLTAYRLARSVAPVAGGTSGKFPQTLVETSPNSWGETDIKTLSSDRRGHARRRQGGQGRSRLAGRRGVGAGDRRAGTGGRRQAGRHRRSRRRASSSSATRTSRPTAGSAFQGNRDLFLNTVNWLAQQENLISIRPRDPQDRRHHADGGPAEPVFC